MNSTLLSNLLRFYEEDPDDPFNVYALAIEYTKSDPEKAAQFFDILLNKHPDYLPTYYHAGSFFATKEEMEKAEEIYRKGVALALLQKNNKAHQELQRAFNSFLDEMDD
ncbi:tetratricopeptide repeat protein [Dyadobacter sp. LJ53]|uniref:tetratricopeptide repeat protein n=1 Tax=Dyadobacter chenwenxiniae TaxID=2906456 RepID=UPI001F346CC8|nr:tetratricopeptide repeat protein [Dyadobacter chenwenxiniae]MCF0050707.1 tetratricopeptide repeat protein [Dyadobacter chenwenxiniae]